MAFKIQEILSANTIKIVPNWVWNEQNGDIVIIKGIDSPENEKVGKEIMEKLKENFLNKEIDLINPERIISGYLLCTVDYEGRNVLDKL